MIQSIRTLSKNLEREAPSKCWSSSPLPLNVLLLHDDAQSIYRKGRGLDFSLSSVGIKAAGRTAILRLNYRNTREILQFACDFASKFMDAKAADDDHIPMVQPESGGISGPGPAFRQFASIGDEITYATRCLKAWHERGDFLGDIAVICMNTDHGKRIAHQLQSLGIPHLHMANRTAKWASHSTFSRRRLLFHSSLITRHFILLFFSPEN